MSRFWRWLPFGTTGLLFGLAIAICVSIAPRDWLAVVRLATLLPLTLVPPISRRWLGPMDGGLGAGLIAATLAITSMGLDAFSSTRAWMEPWDPWPWGYLDTASLVLLCSSALVALVCFVRRARPADPGSLPGQRFDALALACCSPLAVVAMIEARNRHWGEGTLGLLGRDFLTAAVPALLLHHAFGSTPDAPRNRGWIVRLFTLAVLLIAFGRWFNKTAGMEVSISARSDWPLWSWLSHWTLLPGLALAAVSLVLLAIPLIRQAWLGQRARSS